MKKKNFKLTVSILTGFHIGAGNDKIQIGGVDSAVIKDPSSKLPYIPGSSLKGKIRCLLETEGGYGEDSALINRSFGNRKSNQEDQTPTRLIFRDLFLKPEDAKVFETGQLGTEFKTEIVIDRKTGTAAQGGLRTIERVPPGVTFEGDVLLRYTDDTELKETTTLFKEGIKMLNNDYLGGSGSRGYGAVEVKIEDN